MTVTHCASSARAIAPMRTRLYPVSASVQDGHEDQVGPGQRAAQQGKLGIIADQHADFAQRGVEEPQRPAGGDTPLLALEAGHDLLVLIPRAPVGA